MTSALHTTKSLSAYLPIEIIAQHTANGKVVAGPLSARLFDISKIGACLLMSQVMHKKFHLFYSTQENSLLSLQLFVDLPPDIENLKIPAYPLWFNLFQQGQIRNFIMEVEFSPDFEEKKRKKFLSTINRHQKKRNDSWRAQNFFCA
ncbi:MAG: hypothetical protein D3924_10555 [Candidatus Electrothrix sp. AR4]|nr:hypothetical protein [Candidatus Electrothrix sp. AR4]